MQLKGSVRQKLDWKNRTKKHWILGGVYGTKHTWNRAPSDAQFVRLWRTRTDFHPLQVCAVRGVDLLNLLVRGVFTSKALYCASAWKSVSSFHLWQYIYVPAVESKPTSTSKLLLFFGCNKLCALHLESKYYTQNMTFVTLKSCERLAALNMQWYPLS